jgi:FtsH-binding integral membrane protein
MNAALYNINLYGGLGLFSLFVLYDTQKILEKAKNDAAYDPINGSIGIYLDFINIAIRILKIMGASSKDDD